MGRVKVLRAKNNSQEANGSPAPESDGGQASGSDFEEEEYEASKFNHHYDIPSDNQLIADPDSEFKYPDNEFKSLDSEFNSPDSEFKALEDEPPPEKEFVCSTEDRFTELERRLLEMEGNFTIKLNTMERSLFELNVAVSEINNQIKLIEQDRNVSRDCTDVPLFRKSCAFFVKSRKVEEILDCKKVKGKTHFLIRWKGYQPESDTWEPENTLNCPDLIQKFKEKQVNGSKSPKRKNKVKSGGVKKGKISKKRAAPKNDFDYENADENEEYEVDKILEVHHKKNGEREFLIHWKGWTARHNTWEPEKHLNCPELIKSFMDKVQQKKNASPRDLRVAPTSTKRFTLTSKDKGRRLSKRSGNRQRVRYDDAE